MYKLPTPLSRQSQRDMFRMLVDVCVLVVCALCAEVVLVGPRFGRSSAYAMEWRACLIFLKGDMAWHGLARRRYYALAYICGVFFVVVVASGVIGYAIGMFADEVVARPCAAYRRSLGLWLAVSWV